MALATSKLRMLRQYQHCKKLAKSSTDMAVAASQVHVAKGEDHVVAVQTDTIYDPKSGTAVQVEKIAIAVDLGDGKVAMRQQERIVGVVVDAPPKVVGLKAAITKF